MIINLSDISRLRVRHSTTFLVVLTECSCERICKIVLHIFSVALQSHEMEMTRESAHGGHSATNTATNSSLFDPLANSFER